jgi:hypothetical protein
MFDRNIASYERTKESSDGGCQHVKTKDQSSAVLEEEIAEGLLD